MVFACAGTAHAQSTGEAHGPTQVAMGEYFAGEKNQGYVWAGVGAGALGAGGLMFTSDRDGYARAASYPTLTIGLVQAIVGTVLLLRTDSVIARNNLAIAHDPGAFATKERVRIQGVQRAFQLVEFVEITLLVAGGLIATSGSLGQRPSVVGFGTALSLQSAAMLFLDGAAHHRADVYASQLGGTTRD